MEQVPLPPPLPRDARAIDADHLRLLAIFHFVMAGLAVVGLAFLAFHYTMMHFLFENAALWKDAKGGPPPAQVFGIFRVLYALFAGLFISVGVGNLLSGLFIQRRRYRPFSLAVAGINCVNMPLGTLLGAFTFAVLLRGSVRDEYAARKSAIAP